MQRHDTQRPDTARTTKAESAATPGKQTLVEGLGAGRSSGTLIAPLKEAEKGGTDANPKLGAGGGGEEGGEADAHAHDPNAAAGAGADAAAGPAGAVPGNTAAKRNPAAPGGPAGATTAGATTAGATTAGATTAGATTAGATPAGPATAGATPAAAGPGPAAQGAQPAAAGSTGGGSPAATKDAASERQAKAEAGVAAVFGRSGSSATVEAPTAAVSHGSSGREAKEQAVKPTASPTFNGAAGSNDCLPGDATGASVAWTVVAGATTWGVNVTSFTTTGTINVAPWPSKPNQMVTPNTANAVDGGNIESKAGSHNDWKFAIKEMKEYNQAGGGRSSFWHSYEASKAHEWEHWNKDWLKGIVEPAWPTVNTDLDAITIAKADAVDEPTARAKLQVKIDARMKTFDRDLTRKWNAVPDTPGQAGANGYIAGQKVLDTLIAAVEAYGKKKGW
ncbi:MAG TPA: hypothetical protein VLM79_05155 [Kofleriaceae bacterium]|nr:hypothetical protein [Kofleriaceae bacterium]